MNDVPNLAVSSSSLSVAADRHQVKPVVSVIVAVLNEENHVDELIRSILAQDIDEGIELLLVDGMSTDRTRERIAEAVAAYGSPDRHVRLLDNPKQRSPHAFNIGIREALGEFCCIFGAHASYESNYLSECLSVVRSSPDRVACGGCIHTISDGSFQGNLTVDVLTNTFGSSKTSFRTQGVGTVDVIPFPVLRTAELRDAGGYDERLHRNEDNDMCFRLMERGVELRVTDKTSASYYPVGTVKKLLQYARRNGWWNAKTISLGSSGLRVRHFVPSAFVAGVAGSTVSAIVGRGPIRRLGLVGLVGGLSAHLALGIRATFSTNTETRGLARLLIAPTIMAFHFCYGYGTASFLFSRTEPSVQ